MEARKKGECHTYHREQTDSCEQFQMGRVIMADSSLASIPNLSCQAMAATPTIVPGVRTNRRLLGRAVRYMARAGIRQFLDVGTGIPTAGNTHEVAQPADTVRPPSHVSLCSAMTGFFQCGNSLSSPARSAYSRASMLGWAEIRPPDIRLNSSLTGTQYRAVDS
jgi:hypothetical protein